jgi:beta-xylosidase
MKLPNPLIFGFNPDPSIVRVGNDYFIATSTFEYRPGIPIYHSTDLLNWTLVSHVVTRNEQLKNEGVATLGGAWAPTLRHHDGLFYLAVTDAMGRGTVVFTAKSVTDEWSDGIEIDIDGIDPDLAWDVDGTCFMTFSGLILKGADVGTHKGIQQVRIDLKTGQRLEEVRDIWSGTGLMFPEAPHLYFIDGWWYLLIAEGGTERGHSVSIARSKSPDGPFESCPSNPILSARSTARPIQNTGHADIVQTPEGSWVMVLLGMRTRGNTRAFSSLGRETFATNFEWKDSWPVVDPVHLNDYAKVPVFKVNFVGNNNVFSQGHELISVRQLPQDICSISDSGLEMVGTGKLLSAENPTWIGRRQNRFDSFNTVKFSIDSANTKAGLSVRYDEQSHYDIEYSQGKIVARSAIAHLTHEVVVEFELPVHSEVELYMEMTPPGPTFFEGLTSDLVHLGYLDKLGTKHEVAVFDGRYLSAEVTSSFTGRVIGFYVIEGQITVKEFSEQQPSHQG